MRDTLLRKSSQQADLTTNAFTPLSMHLSYRDDAGWVDGVVLTFVEFRN